MKTQEQKRLIKQNNINIECYYYNYFKSPGLTEYPQLLWVNDDYNLIKQVTITHDIVETLANNLFKVGQRFNLFKKLDYFIMMPKKPTSVSSLELVIIELINIIKKKLNYEIVFINDLFQVDNYRKFWENKLKINERQMEIANKIHLLPKYINFFNKKNIVIIDDVVASGTSILQAALEIINNNNDFNIKALCYGSVYKWEEIYK